MSVHALPRILVVDDEEAILETMAFTFEKDYEVLTARDARTGLALLDEHAPVAAVVTDQRMPEMNGVEFLAEVCRRHPNTTRIVLTGYADTESVVQAINEGHAYAYVAKPWEPDELKQLLRRAVDHHRLLRENEQLMGDLRRANLFLGAAMDEIPMGALVVDEEGVVREVNRPARRYLVLKDDPRGRRLGAEPPGSALARLDEVAGGPEPHELEITAAADRFHLRVATRALRDPDGKSMGRVYLLREISHEPLRGRFEEALHAIVHTDEGLRERLRRALEEFESLQSEVYLRASASPEMATLDERLGRARTAIENWLAVDEALAREPYPDARMLMERVRLAGARWPLPGSLPQRVRELALRVEAYYESGEKSGERVL